MPIIGLIANVFVQVFSFRLIPRIGMLKSIISGFTAGFLIVVFCEFYANLHGTARLVDYTAILLVNVIAYSALGYCYFHFINLGETARRIRILREIYDSGEAGLTMHEILQKYNVKEILEKRAGRLQNNKQIILKEGKYFINSPIMFLIAKAIIMQKLVLLGKKSEFD